MQSITGRNGGKMFPLDQPTSFSEFSRHIKLTRILTKLTCQSVLIVVETENLMFSVRCSKPNKIWLIRNFTSSVIATLEANISET